MAGRQVYTEAKEEQRTAPRVVKAQPKKLMTGEQIADRIRDLVLINVLPLLFAGGAMGWAHLHRPFLGERILIVVGVATFVAFPFLYVLVSVAILVCNCIWRGSITANDKWALDVALDTGKCMRACVLGALIAIAMVTAVVTIVR